MNIPHIRSLIRILAMLIIASSSPSIKAETIIVGGYDYPPFMDSNSKQGIYHKLMLALSQQTGLTFQWQYYPYARLNKLFEKGLVHIEVGSAPEWTTQSSEPGIYTEAFYELQDIALFKSGEAFKIKRPTDIKGKTIGVVRGYGFEDFENMFKSKQAIRSDTTDESQLLQMLLNKRMDSIFINKDVFRHHSIDQPLYRELEQGDIVGSYEIALRIHPSYKKIIPSLNKAIKTLKQKDLILPMFQ